MPDDDQQHTFVKITCLHHLIVDVCSYQEVHYLLETTGRNFRETQSTAKKVAMGTAGTQRSSTKQQPLWCNV